VRAVLTVAIKTASLYKCRLLFEFDVHTYKYHILNNENVDTHLTFHATRVLTEFRQNMHRRCSLAEKMIPSFLYSCS